MGERLDQDIHGEVKSLRRQLRKTRTSIMSEIRKERRKRRRSRAGTNCTNGSETTEESDASAEDDVTTSEDSDGEDCTVAQDSAKVARNGCRPAAKATTRRPVGTIKRACPTDPAPAVKATCEMV